MHIWPNGFRGEEFKKSANQKQESPVARVREYHRSRLPKFHKVWYFSILSRSDCPTVRLAKKSVVVRWEIVGNWLDHN
jgi:hypothetical protein